MATPIEIKKQCCELYENGKKTKDIYNEYYSKNVEEPMLYNSFRACLSRWKRKKYPDETTLECGTYAGFTAHDATVQVSGNGEIVQAWIKQKASDLDVEAFMEALKETVEPYDYIPIVKDAYSMLEIPLFDMHWGIAYIDYYTRTLNEIMMLIESKHWDRIEIPFGQDFFHNDSIIKGETTKGTKIEKVDMRRAVYDGKRFMYTIIDSALVHSNSVKVIYSPGNHDRSISWMFVEVLLERYGPEIVDDSMDMRKVIVYGQNAVMVTHGNSKRATAKNLAPIFSISFPEEFCKANIREVHAGHLHDEMDQDVFGVMVRRMSTGAKTDNWSNDEDFIGNHKRFMLFEWSPDKLKSIHYI